MEATEAANTHAPFKNYSEAERYTGLHRVTLWRAVRDGRLRASGPGRAVRFHVQDLDTFMLSARGDNQE
jgi:excisionase family DNA binding protein